MTAAQAWGKIQYAVPQKLKYLIFRGLSGIFHSCIFQWPIFHPLFQSEYRCLFVEDHVSPNRIAARRINDTEKSSA